MVDERVCVCVDRKTGGRRPTPRIATFMSFYIQTAPASSHAIYRSRPHTHTNFISFQQTLFYIRGTVIMSIWPQILLGFVVVRVYFLKNVCIVEHMQRVDQTPPHTCSITKIYTYT